MLDGNVIDDPVIVEPEPPSPGAIAAPTLPLSVTLGLLVLTYWCVDIVSPTLPVLRDDLALTATAAGLVMSLFFGGRLLATLPAAYLIDRIGPRWTAAGGAAILLVGSVLVALAIGLSTLLPARMLQGAGVALLVSAGLLSVLRALPGGGAAMTAFNVAAGVGSAAGLAAGGILTTAIGWRAPFWLTAGLAAAMLVAAALSRPTTGSKAVHRDEESAQRDGAVPVRHVLTPLAANLLVYANYAIWVVGLPLYAAGRFGSDANQVGVLLLILNAIHLAAAFPAGRAIRHLGPKPVLIAGLATTAVGLLLVRSAPTVWWMLAPMALYAVGEISANSAAGDLLLRMGGGGGRAVGMVRLSSDVGIVVGPAFAGWLADAAGLGAPFIAFGVLSAFAVVVLLAQRQLRTLPG